MIRTNLRFLLAAIPLVACCLSLLLFPSSVYASWCTDREDSLEAAEVVFSGKVLNITQNGGDDLVLFSVSKVWRGTIQARDVVRTGETSRDCGVGHCGYQFKLGNDYLVFAYRWPAQPGFDMHGSLTVPPGVPTMLVTDKCSRTSLLTAAQADIASLGLGQLPAAGLGAPGNAGNQFLYAVMALAFVVVGSWLRFHSHWR